MEKLVLGVDLGTGSLKFLLMKRNGEIIESVSSNYELLTPQKGYCEQKPNDWIEAFKSNVSKLNEIDPNLITQVVALSISGQMHSLIMLDKNSKVLRNAILWNDVRTFIECEEITEMVPNLLDITKNRALEGFTLPKLLWCRKHETEIFNKMESFLLPKDYLAFWLTGHKCMDFSDAAGTLLLDIEKKSWSQEVLTSLGLSIESCPKLVSTGTLIGTLTEEVMSILGIKNEVKVFAGGADNACAAVGAGINNPTKAMSSIGTSGVFLSYEENTKNDYQGKLHFFNHAIPKSYYSMGVTLAAGSSLDWFVNTFKPNLDFSEISNLLDKSTIGSNSLLFSPYISGERSPHFDSKIRGSFVGIDISHNFNDFLRAVIEGITFSLRDSKEIIEKFNDVKINQIVSVGGGAKNDSWLQIQADVFDSEILVLESEQGPGIGACYIAATGIGWFKSISSCMDELVKIKKTITPDKTSVKKYEEIYRNYKKIYSNTRKIMVE